jgi:sugar lactone lactonase YvrE
MGAGNLVKFSPTGKVLARWGRPGPKRGELDFCTPSRPSGVAIDAAQNVYVVGKCSATVEKFSPRGKLLRIYG